MAHGFRDQTGLDSGDMLIGLTLEKLTKMVFAGFHTFSAASRVPTSLSNANDNDMESELMLEDLAIWKNRRINTACQEWVKLWQLSTIPFQHFCSCRLLVLLTSPPNFVQKKPTSQTTTATCLWQVDEKDQ